MQPAEPLLVTSPGNAESRTEKPREQNERRNQNEDEHEQDD